MIALVLALALLQNDDSPRATPPVTAGARTIALRRDPTSLPKSAPDRWKGFDAARLKAADMPAEMELVRAAIFAGDMPEALDGLYRVLDRVPEFPPALHQMGVLYFRLQRYGDSIVPLERYVALVPSRVGDTRVLGHDYYSLGRYGDAEAHYQRVLATSPADVEALRGLALTRMRRGDAQSALALLTRVVEAQPDHAEAWNAIAQIRFDQGESDDALAAAERARALDPFDPRAWFILGRVLLDLGREAEGRAARARFDELSIAAQAIRRLETRRLYAPHDVAIGVGLLEAQRKIGNGAKVQEALAFLRRESPRDVGLAIRALDALAELRDDPGAKAAARRLSELAGSSLPAWKRLEAWYASTGDVEGQAHAAERARALHGGPRGEKR